jgi:hypothetical protein
VRCARSPVKVWAGYPGVGLSSVMERLLDLARGLRDDAEEWCEDKSALVRAPLYLYLVYAGVRHLVDPMYRSWFAGITLAFHEIGHLFFSAFGHTMMLLGGSLFQLLIPTLAATYLLFRQRDWFGLVVCLSWLAFAEWELATYVADASREQLALVGFSGSPEHDWSSLLTQWRLLNHDDAIALVIRVAAFATWAFSTAFGAWLLWRMFRSERT